MSFLTDLEQESLFDAALPLYVTGQRGALLSGMDPSFVATLAPVNDPPATQLVKDVGGLLGGPARAPTRLADGEVPLKGWLLNAVMLSGPTEAGAALDRIWEIVRTRPVPEPDEASATSALPPLQQQQVQTAQAPAEEARPVTWALVVGTRGREWLVRWRAEKEELVYAGAIGAALAARGFSLVSFGWPGVHAEASTAFQGALTYEEVRDRVLRVVSPDDPAVFGTNAVQFVQDEEETVRRSVAIADIVFLVGGVAAAAEVAEAALLAWKPVVPLAATGGAARRVHRRILEKWGVHGELYGDVTREAFEDLARPAEVSRYVSTCLELGMTARRTMRRT